jgi:hypothetical protein
LQACNKGGKGSKGAVITGWGEEQDAAFVALKTAVCQSPCLVLPDPALPFILQTDASDYCLGGCLMQMQDGKLHPVAFHSRMFQGSELHWPVHDKEGIAVLACLRKWRCHLGSGQFVLVQSDHKSLQHLMSQPHMSQRQCRWMEELADFNFKVEYLPGPKNLIADWLSRPHRDVTALMSAVPV